MTSPAIPSTMRAWQFSSTSGGLEKNMKINESAPLPKRKTDYHLVEVITTALNPVDYKPAEIPFVSRLVLPNPATPVLDFCGKVVQPAEGSNVKPGEIVYGFAAVHILGGALAQYTVAKKDGVATLPPGIDPKLAASGCVAGLTAYQSITPFCKQGNSIFINGGSGGTGVFGIQIAKALGCYVVTTCSSANVELCKSLGADEVIDYKTSNVLEELKKSGRKFDHVIDNVGHDLQLYWRSHEYTSPKAIFVPIGAKLTFGFLLESIAMRIWPGFLGGGKRKITNVTAQARTADLTHIGQWMSSGEVKPIIDSEFKFEDAPKAFERMKTGRAKGKIIVEVAPEAGKQ